MRLSNLHIFELRVYYEDTDLAGIVYYANYLKFIERGRSEWIRERGVDQRKLKDDEGLVFVVRKIEADYLSPAKFDDIIEVHTQVEAVTGARIVLSQDVFRGKEMLFSSTVTLVCMTSEGQIARIPAILRRELH